MIVAIERSWRSNDGSTRHLYEVVIASPAAATPSPAPPYSPQRRTLYRIPLVVSKVLRFDLLPQPCGTPEDCEWFWYRRLLTPHAK